MTKQDIIQAYVTIRSTNHTIPDQVLDFMYHSALDRFDEQEDPAERKKREKDRQEHLRDFML